MSEDLVVDCPICGFRIRYAQRKQYKHFPFCSERCKLIDLGKWFDGEYSIEGDQGQVSSDEREPDGTKPGES